MPSLKLSYCHRLSTGMEKGLTFGEMLANSTARFPDNIALRFGDTQYTYTELKQAVDGMAASLLKLGLKRGDRVGILFPDWPEYTIALYACATIGAVVSPMNPLYRKTELTTILNHLEAKAFFMPDEWRGFSFVDLMEQARADFPFLERVIVKGEVRRSWMLDIDDLIKNDPNRDAAADA